nr:MAG TPA: hypothetical protein [Caudoviricetes sp.]
MALRKPDFDINPSFFKVAVPISSARTNKKPHKEAFL